MIIVLWGYDNIHTFERISWPVSSFVYIILIARLLGLFPMIVIFQKRRENIGNTVGFISCLFGFSIVWSTSPADFTT